MKQRCPFCHCELEEDDESETVFEMVSIVLCPECCTMSEYTDDGALVTSDAMAEMLADGESGGVFND